jgi:hypothetical protein
MVFYEIIKVTLRHSSYSTVVTLCNKLPTFNQIENLLLCLQKSVLDPLMSQFNPVLISITYYC